MKTNKKISILGTVVLLGLSPAAFGQSSGDEAFGKGSNVIGIGVGLGGEYTYFGDGYTSTPNIVLSYDNGTFGNVGPGTISLGGLLSYKGISYDYTDFHSGYSYDQAWTYYVIGIRSAYHLSIPSAPRFDPYAGIMLAYYDIGYKESSTDPYYDVPGSPYYSYYANTYGSYLAFSLYIGARYNLSDHIGLWLELGYGYSNAALGVSFKL
jgi:hypothetical protein